MGQVSPVYFSCHSCGSQLVALLWVINGTEVQKGFNMRAYERDGFVFIQSFQEPNCLTTSLAIDVTSANHNETNLNCLAAYNKAETVNSRAVTLTITGNVTMTS